MHYPPPSNHRVKKIILTRPGMKTFTQEVLPPIQRDVPPSKRQPLIANEDALLDSNQKILHEGTIARNRAYQERLDEVWRLTADWESKLKVEAMEAEESIVHMKKEYQHHVDTFNESILKEVKDAFDHIDKDLVPPAPAHLDRMDSSLNKFVKDTVPKNIEALIGEISRKLRTEYEYFSIEQSKEEKRENKIVRNASMHVQATAQHFTDEDAFLQSYFHNLDDDVLDSERRSARLYEHRRSLAVKNILEIKAEIDEMCSLRVSEDNEVLDTVIETQGLLQETVLEHFGSAGAKPPKKNFDKLEKRMNDINKRRGDDGNGKDEDGSISQRSESKEGEEKQ